MKKLLVLLALCMVLSVVLVACQDPDQPTEDTTAGSTEAPTTEAPTTEAPTTEEPTTEAPTTDTTDAPTTEPPTTQPPEPPADPVTIHISKDEIRYMVGEGQVGQAYAPGAFDSWTDKIATVEDYNVDAIVIWGWAGFFAETIGEFGYQIDDNDAVFADFTFSTEQGVIDAAAAGGAKSASRFYIPVPVLYLNGEHTIKALVRDAAGTVEVFHEFTLNKAENPNAPVFFVPAADMASSIPGSPDVASAEMSADGKYITITTGTVGDPYYQLPMINNKGYQAGFIAIKYRTTVQEIGGQIFIGSGAGPNGQGDNPVFDYVADGKWHVAIIPLEGVASINESGINYLRWDMFQRGTENVIDMAYIGAFQSAEAALAYDAQFKGDYIDILNTSMDSWTVSGHAPGLTGSDSPDKGGMIKAGGLEKGALLHQGSIGLGELDLAQFSKMIVYYGIDNSQVTIDHWTASANNRLMITNVDTNMTNSPAEENIVASAGYELKGWSLVAVEIDLTGVDYAGPVFVSYDTLPGTFMLVGAIELVYDPYYVAPEAPETPAEDPYYALQMVQAKTGETLYFTGEMAGEYLATSTDPAAAAKVYVETSENGLRQYILVDGVKNYIEIHTNDAGKVRVCLTTEPQFYFVFNEEADTYVINFNETDVYYLGTYNDFTTIGCSLIKYITGDNAANVGVSQYVVEWVEFPTVETPGEPEEPAGPVIVDRAECDEFKGWSFDGFYLNSDLYFEQDGNAASKLEAIGNTVTISGVQTIGYRGWTSFKSAPAAAFGYYIVDVTDGVVVGEFLQERPDLAGAGIANGTGFKIDVPVADLAAGTYTTGMVAILTDGTVVKLYEITLIVEEVATVEPLVVDFQNIDDSDIVPFTDAQFAQKVIFGNYNTVVNLGTYDLSLYSKAVIKYATDVNYKNDGLAQIGFKSSDAPWGFAGTFNDTDIIASVAMTDAVPDTFWALTGLRDAEIDLSGVTYNGDVWVGAYNVEGQIYAIESITLIP